jgi:hypothetical protein
MLFKLASARETFSWLCKFCSVEQTDRVAVYCQQRAICSHAITPTETCAAHLERTGGELRKSDCYHADL